MDLEWQLFGDLSNLLLEISMNRDINIISKLMVSKMIAIRK